MHLSVGLPASRFVSVGRLIFALSRFCIADHGPPKVPGAVQTCGIASSRRALSAYPIFIAPGFILFSESGLIRSAGFCWINLTRRAAFAHIYIACPPDSRNPFAWLRRRRTFSTGWTTARSPRSSVHDSVRQVRHASRVHGVQLLGAGASVASWRQYINDGFSHQPHDTRLFLNMVETPKVLC